MIRLFDRTPGYQAATFAEARSLVDDGLDLELVLDLFGEDGDWLAPLLRTADEVARASAAEEPSYYFEASLKAKFLAAGAAAARGERPAAALPVPAPLPIAGGSPLGVLRTAVAGLTVMATAAALGVVTLALVTAGSAAPGDWNYSLKMAQERLQYSLASGDQRVNIQLKQTESRVYELQRAAAKGDVSEGDIGRLQREARALAEIARANELDDVQKARLKNIGDTAAAALSEVRDRQATLNPAVETTIETVNSAVAAGLGSASVEPVQTPPATPAPTSTATPATSTPTPPPTPATGTPSATETAPPTPATGTPTPEPTAEPSPSPSSSPSPTATAPGEAGRTPAP